MADNSYQSRIEDTNGKQKPSQAIQTITHALSRASNHTIIMQRPENPDIQQSMHNAVTSLNWLKHTFDACPSTQGACPFYDLSFALEEIGTLFFLKAETGKGNARALLKSLEQSLAPAFKETVDEQHQKDASALNNLKIQIKAHNISP